MHLELDTRLLSELGEDVGECARDDATVSVSLRAADREGLAEPVWP